MLDLVLGHSTNIGELLGGETSEERNTAGPRAIKGAEGRERSSGELVSVVLDVLRDSDINEVLLGPTEKVCGLSDELISLGGHLDGGSGGSHG